MKLRLAKKIAQHYQSKPDTWHKGLIEQALALFDGSAAEAAPAPKKAAPAPKKAVPAPKKAAPAPAKAEEAPKAAAKKSAPAKEEKAAAVDYSGMTVAALKAEAKSRGLSGYTKLKKAELIALLS